jgi:hypothetical protein
MDIYYCRIDNSRMLIARYTNENVDFTICLLIYYLAILIGWNAPFREVGHFDLVYTVVKFGRVKCKV